MRHRCVNLVASFAVLFALGVCGDAVANSSSIIELKDAGSGAKAPLLYTFTTGNTTQWSFEADSQMAFAQMPKQALPTMKATLSLTATKVDKKGTGTFTGRIENAVLSLPSNPKATKLLKSINDQLVRLKSLKIRLKVDRHGKVFDVNVGKLKNASAEITTILATFNQQFQQVATPLPTQPVGEGATWRVTQQVTANNVKLKQQTTYSLTRRNSATGEFSLSIGIRQSASPQALKLPGVPSNVSVRLLKAEGDGKSTMNINSAYLGASGNVSVGLKMAVEMSMGAQKSKTAFSFDSSAKLKANYSTKRGQ